MSNVGWLATQQFVILVPDPILFAPWPVLLDRGERCHSLFNKTQLHLRFSLPCLENTLFLATSETSVVECAFMDGTFRHVLDEQLVLPLAVVVPLVPSPITSRSAAEAAPPPPPPEMESMKGDLVSKKRYWTLPKSCGSQSSEWEERKKIRAKRGSLCARCRSRKTVTCPWSSRGGARVSPGLIARQMEKLEALEEERKMSTSSSSSAWASLVSSVKTHPHHFALSGCGVMECSLRDWEERRLPATECRPVSACTVLLHRGSTQSGCVVFPSVTLPSQDEPIVRRDEEVLDARRGLDLRVGAAQEEEVWRRRAL